MVAFMHQGKSGRLLYKFIILVLPLLISSIGLTTLVISLTNYRYYHKTIHQDYGNIVRSSAGEIDLFMKNARQRLDSLALMIVASKLDSWQTEMALTAFLHANPQFESAAVFSPEGKQQIAATIGDNEWMNTKGGVFNEARSGKSAISAVMMGSGHMPYMDIAVPLFHLKKVNAVLAARLNLKWVWDVLQGISIGKTGQVYILDVSGKYIAHREIERVVRPPEKDRPEILEKLRRSRAPVRWTETTNGVKTYNYGIYVPDLDWIVVLSQPAAEIYGYFYLNLHWAVLMSLIIGASAVLLGWRFIRRILAPVRQLHEQVRIIGRGDLDRKIALRTGDEIEDLGKAFNEMTDSLKAHIEREVETARALAHAKNLAVLGTTSSKITHEVGNFLNNTDMALAALKREPVSERAGKILAILDRESVRIKELIGNFLKFAKKPELHLQRQPLDLIIGEVLSICQAEFAKRLISVVVDWPSHIPMIRVDAGQVHQVFTNLIKNSLEAMNKEGALRIGGTLEKNVVLVTIADTGPGMDADTLSHIFEPFFTTKGKNGTGLGMSIVKTVMDAHRGTIECDSTRGRGTVFTLRFPLY